MARPDDNLCPLPAQVEAQLEKILADGLFAGSAALSRLLRHVVGQALEGNTDRLKEYSIGVEIFQRGEAFDPRIDPIVRVQARNLRARLKEYYEAPGKDDPVLIDLPKGSYVPAFRLAAPAVSAVPHPPGLRLWWAAAALVTTVALVAGALEYYGQRFRRSGAASVAVLPFLDLSPNHDQEYFSDGLTDELINALSQVEGLRVVARTSAFRYKGAAQDVREVGRALNVRSVLEGSVRREGGRVRVTAQLVDTANGYQLWSGAFDKEMTGVFSLQDEISSAIVDTLRLKLANGQGTQCARCRTTNVEAYNRFLEGRHFTYRLTEAGLRKGIESFAQAIALDPEFAPAYAGLADAYNLLAQMGELRPKEAMPKARAAARRALSLAPNLAEAHVALAAVLEAYDWDWAGAEREYRLAVQLNPSSPWIRYWYAGYLWDQGRTHEAFREIRKAYDMDPLSIAANLYMAKVYSFEGAHGRAAAQYRKILDLDPSQARVHVNMAWIELETGKREAAVRSLEKARQLSGGPMTLAAIAHVYARMDMHEPARKILAEMEQLSSQRYISPYDRALVHAVLAEKEPTISWLEKAYEERCAGLVFLKHFSKFPFLKDDPRFVALVANMHFRS
jgi:serine/threonine-protein kinase